ncbi:MAG: M3 family metallopeptidase [Pseudomonadota bacterium]
MKRILLLSVVFLTSCVSQNVRNLDTALEDKNLSPGCLAIKKFFNEDLTFFQDRVDRASAEYQEEQWKVEANEPGASAQKMGTLFEAYQKVAYDKDVLRKTLELAKSSIGVEAQCAWKRRLDRAKQLLETSILTKEAVIKKEKENQDKQDALANQSNAFRIQVPGEAEPVSKALLSKRIGSLDDRAQREALFKQFNAARADAWLKWGFRDLIKSRNAEARLAGFKNYYDYRYFRNQLDLKNYLANVKEVRTKLAPQIRKILAVMGKQAGISKVEAWDLRYLREKSASGEVNALFKEFPETEVMKVASDFYTSLGIDVASYDFKMDLYPRPGKNTHAFAMGVVAPHVSEKGELLSLPKPDIRFLANLKKPVQWDDISTIIHELGHAIHFGEIRQPIAAFRGFGSVETEAIAMTLERMADSSEFLEDVLPKYTAVGSEALKPILSKQERATRIEQAFVLLRQVLFSEFERAVYMNPDQDYGKLWASIFKEYWGVSIKPEQADWDVDHFVMAPVYVQNYAIGILMVQQFYESILKEFGTAYRSKAIGDKLRAKYFGPGLEFDYLTLTQNFTGSPLTAKAALRLLEGISE